MTSLEQLPTPPPPGLMSLGCSATSTECPVLVILAYDSVEEAVEIANGTEYGLGAHVQGEDLLAARAVAMRIRSGQVHINNPPWSPDAPFGGYKGSGNGREYGVEGLEEYLETKAILGWQSAQA